MGTQGVYAQTTGPDVREDRWRRRGLFSQLSFMKHLVNTHVCSSRSSNHTPEGDTHFIPVLQMGKPKAQRGEVIGC